MVAARYDLAEGLRSIICFSYESYTSFYCVFRLQSSDSNKRESWGPSTHNQTCWVWSGRNRPQAYLDLLRNMITMTCVCSFCLE